jgi:tRNA(Ile)-lysidine synthase
LNHGFRGEEARADAEFVKELADSLNVPWLCEFCDVPAMAKRLHLSSQEAARAARQEFLERAADNVEADLIALGHTFDDHIETVLLNLIRGAGPDGLKGLPERSGRIIRPLLRVSRKLTASYCHEQGIRFRSDASNASTEYLRNRIRSELLPMLESYYNPAIREAISRLSVISSDESQYLAAMAAEQLKEVVIERSDGGLTLSRLNLEGLGKALSRRVLRLAIEEVHRDLKDIGFETIEKILHPPCSAAALSLTMPGGHTTVDVQGDSIFVRRLKPPSNALSVAAELAIPGITPVPALGITVEARLKHSGDLQEGGWAARMDRTALGLPLTVRNRRDGDRIQPLGLKGSKKLQDVMVDRKIPSELRGRIPIITDRDGPVWIVGHVLSERVKVTDETDTALELIVSPLAGLHRRGFCT